jgi:hypothetical protein
MRELYTSALELPEDLQRNIKPRSGNRILNQVVSKVKLQYVAIPIHMTEILGTNFDIPGGHVNIDKILLVLLNFQTIY